MTQLVWPNGTTTEPTRSSSYGPRQPIWTGRAWTRPFHVGTDHHSIGAICSIGAGTVVESGDGGWAGWYVLVYLGEIDGVRTWVRYCHLTDRSHLNRGDQVGIGDLIGREGETGDTDGIHLHWEITQGRVDRGNWSDPGSTVDPRVFVATRLITTQKGPHDMARILNLRDTINGRDPETPTMYFDGGPGVGIKGIRSAADKNMLERYLNDAPGTFMNRGEIRHINEVYLAPSPPASVVEAAVKKVLLSMGGSVDAAAVALAVEAVLQDDFAAIPAAPVTKLGEKLTQ